jgi:hypothetical protein
LLFSTYGVGRRLFGKNVGLLSVFFLLSYPSIFSLSRHLFLDFASISIVIFTIYLLLRSEFFKNKKYLILFCFFLGVSILIKFTNLLFFIIILIYIIFSSFHKNDSKIIKNFLMFLSCALALLLLWVIPNISTFFFVVEKSVKSLTQIATQPYKLMISYPQLIKYIFDALLRKISLFHAILFLIAVSIFLKKTIFYKLNLQNEKWATLLIFQIFIVYFIFFTLATYFPSFQLHDTFYRHITSILPLIAIFTASQISSEKIKNHVWILGLISFFQFLIISLGVPNLVGGFLNTDMYYFFPTIKNWKIEEILNEISFHNKSGAKCLVIGDGKFLRAENFQIYSILNKKEVCIFENFPLFAYYFEAPPSIKNYDFIIIGNLWGQSIYPIRNATTLNYIIQQLNENFECYNQYKIESEYNYPFDVNVSLCKNKKITKLSLRFL